MERLTVSKDVRDYLEENGWNKVAEVVRESAYNGLNCCGKVAFSFDVLKGEDGDFIEYKTDESDSATAWENKFISQEWAPLVDEYLRTDVGLNVHTERSDSGIITRIVVTLK